MEEKEDYIAFFLEGVGGLKAPFPLLPMPLIIHPFSIYTRSLSLLYLWLRVDLLFKDFEKTFDSVDYL